MVIDTKTDPHACVRVHNACVHETQQENIMDQYIVIEAKNLKSMAKYVNKYINMGYIPFGSPFKFDVQSPDEYGIRLTIAQAMIFHTLAIDVDSEDGGETFYDTMPQAIRFFPKNINDSIEPST